MRRKTVALTFKPTLASSSARITTGDGSLVLDSRLSASHSVSGRCRLENNIWFCHELNQESFCLSGRSLLGVSAGVRFRESAASPRWRQPPRSLSVSLSVCLSVSLMERLRLPDYQVSSTSTTGDNKFPVTSTSSPLLL